MKKYRAVLIGCGRIGETHIGAFASNSERTELIAVCDPVEERALEKAADYKSKVPGAAILPYSDYQKMLCEVKPDIAVIATESGKHAQMSINCLNAGAHVICEKPMALSTLDARNMIDVSKKAGKKLAVCFQNRFNPPVGQLRKAIDEGRLGKLLHGMVQVRWFRDPPYYAEAPWRGTWAEDGGTLMNQCIHGIDLLQWMMGGEAVRVHAQTRRFIRPIEAEDYGAAIVEFKNGAVGIIEGSACIYPDNLNETLSVFGECGSVVIGGIAVNKMETWRIADALEKGDTEETVLNPHEDNSKTNSTSVYGGGHSALYRDFILALDEGRDPYVTGEKGIKALEIILAIYKSQKTGKAVDLPCEFSTMDMQGYDFEPK